MRPGASRARRLVLLAAALLVAPAAAVAQEGPALRVVGPGDRTRHVELALHRGYAALPAAELERLGWTVRGGAGEWSLRYPEGVSVHLREGSPFFRWGGELLQMTAAPYVVDGRLHVPAQLVTDFLPVRLPDLYAAVDGGGLRLKREAPAGGAGEAGAESAHVQAGARAAGGAAAEPPDADGATPPPEGPEPASERRVVIIDPGHGGEDTGAWGPGGIREKDLALGVALALERALARYPGLEVHLTRRTDVLVPLWKRGEWATRTRGERPGVFISIHANALPNRPDHRGFETYFLSDARTEHERRVAANENAPLALEAGEGAGAADSELSFILKELRNLDHPHWSALLAQLVQDRLGPVHPGPDRGVKQGPFAVITNALMPAVLVETGFLTNREEARTLADPAFQEELADALARAVADFFERYPPGRGVDLEGAGPTFR